MVEKSGMNVRLKMGDTKFIEYMNCSCLQCKMSAKAIPSKYFVWPIVTCKLLHIPVIGFGDTIRIAIFTHPTRTLINAERCKWVEKNQSHQSPGRYS
jgi:hypothetical protein